MATILVVEDDVSTLSVLNVFLKEHGYKTLAATDAAMAVQQIRQGRPDLILLDYKMPGGSGLTVLNQLKSFMDMAGTPVIVMSGVAPAEIMKNIPLSPSVKFMSKPLDLHKLLEWIVALLGRA